MTLGARTEAARHILVGWAPAAADPTSQLRVRWSGTSSIDARRIGDACALVETLTNLGRAQLRSGEQHGRAKLERALTLSQRHGLAEQAARVFCCLLPWSLEERRLALARAYLHHGLDYCGEFGLDGWRLELLAYGARQELDRGELKPCRRPRQPRPAKPSKQPRRPVLGARHAGAGKGPPR